jgi:hypothetical protein
VHSYYLEGIHLKSILIIFGLTKAVQLHDFCARVPLLREEHVNDLGLEGVHEEDRVVSQQEESLVDDQEVLVELDLPVDLVLRATLRGHRLQSVVVP